MPALRKLTAAIEAPAPLLGAPFHKHPVTARLRAFHFSGNALGLFAFREVGTAQELAAPAPFYNHGLSA